MSKVTEIIKILDQMCSDNSIPRNVKAILTTIKTDLRSDREPSVRIDAAIQYIEGLSQDPNLSAYAREQIWNLTSLLSEISN